MPPPVMPPPIMDDNVGAAIGTAVALALTIYILGFYLTAPKPSVAGKVTKIVVYPLKSAKGIEVQRHKLDAMGLEFDRKWMVVDANGSFLSQRRAPKLATVEVKLPTSHDDPLCLSVPGTLYGSTSISVPVISEASMEKMVRCWGDHCNGIDQGDKAAAWLSKMLGVDGARLVRMADGVKRFCDTKWGPAGATTAFSDGFPLLLANESSLAQLNGKLAERKQPPVQMHRFRPNLVMGPTGPAEADVTAEALAPFAEDGWSKIRVGGARGVPFGVVKPCARCKMITIDQKTGVPDKRPSSAPTKGTPDDDDEGGGPAAQAEPTATLRTFRSAEALGFHAPFDNCDVFFGQNIVLDGKLAGREIAVGDVVVATPRRKRGLFSKGVLGVDY